MFGLRFIKTQPNQYVIQFRNGRPRRQGAGLSILYFASTYPSSRVIGPTQVFVRHWPITLTLFNHATAVPWAAFAGGKPASMPASP